MRTMPACATAIPLGRRLPNASSNLPGRPDLDTDPEVYRTHVRKPRTVPIRSCSRWGLPCRRRCRQRGALLPHLFTLAAVGSNAPRRSVLCGTFPRLAPAGCYPAPLVHGARTFLPDNLSVSPERPSDRLTEHGMGTLRGAVKRQGARGRGRARQWFSPGHALPANPVTSRAWIHRSPRRRAPAESGVGMPPPRRA